jgi:hypothetical protein
MSKLFVKKENLLAPLFLRGFDPAYNNSLSKAGELFSFRTANVIFSQIFAVLNFCFFSFKRKED